MYLIPKYKNLPERFLPDNALLLLSKFIQMMEQSKNDGFNFLKIQRVKDNVHRNLKKPEIKNNINKKLSLLNKRMHVFSKKYQLTTSNRLVVGLGSTSVLESSIKLHHIYGVPYIPSSAIKGVLRAYKIWELSDWNLELFKAFEFAISLVYEKCKSPDTEFSKKLNEINSKELNSEQRVLIEKKDEIIKKKNELFNFLSIFGSQSVKGSLIVFDAFPEIFKGFDIDIMNPHYPEYYQGNEPPADWQNPTPIKFLAIPKGTQFNFYFLNPYKHLETDLRNALSVVGIGAKTSLGYGVFSV